MALLEHSLDLLQSTALAYMATIGPKGEPQVSAVWFTWDGTHLLFALNKKTPEVPQSLARATCRDRYRRSRHSLPRS